MSKLLVFNHSQIHNLGHISENDELKAKVEYFEDKVAELKSDNENLSRALQGNELIFFDFINCYLFNTNENRFL
jgi:hypothetical protein